MKTNLPKLKTLIAVLALVVIGLSLKYTSTAHAQTPTSIPVIFGTDKDGFFIKQTGGSVKMRMDATTGMWTIPSKTTPSGDNLISNGNFANDVTGAGAQADNWNNNFNSNCATCVYGTDNMTANTGQYSFKLKNAAAGTIANVASDLFPVTTGKTYNVSVDVIGNFSTGFTGQILFYGATGATAYSDAAVGAIYTFANSVATVANWSTPGVTLTGSIQVPSTCNPGGTAPCTRARVYIANSPTGIADAQRNIGAVRVTLSGISNPTNASVVSSGAFGSSVVGNGAYYSFPGSLGIGTAVPGAKLEILGTFDGATTLSLKDASINQQTSAGKIVFNSGTVDVGNIKAIYNAIGNHRLDFGTDGTAVAMSILGSNVGIGTTVPGAKLTIQSGSGQSTDGLRIQEAANTPYDFVQSPNGDFDIFYGASSRLHFLASNGNVGIGTTVPAQKLDVNGYIQVDSINGEGGTIKLVGNNGTNYYIENNNGTLRGINSPWTLQTWAIDQSGNASFNGTGNFNGAGNSYFTGSVGIGTTGPVAKLDLGATGIARVYSAGGSGWGGSDNAAGFRTAWTSGYGASFEAWDGGAPKWGIYKWNATTPAVVMQGQYDTTNVNFTGSVGIGTTVPGVKLDVGGSIKASTGASTGSVILNSGGASNVGYIDFNSPAGVRQAYLGYTAANLNLTLENSASFNIMNGSVGIGTTGPSNTLQIGSVGATGYGGNQLAIGNGTNALAVLVTNTLTTLYTGSGGISIPGGVITSTGTFSGNVGIGTTGPLLALDVRGAIKVSNVNNPQVTINRDAAGKIDLGVSDGAGNFFTSGVNAGDSIVRWAASQALRFGISGSPSVTIDSSGFVGIGTTAPTARLHVKGSGATSATYPLIIVDSAGTNTLYLRDDGFGWLRAPSWSYGSDRRMKENINYIDSGLKQIMGLKPATFDYIKGVKNEAGFIAQDVQAIFPNLVTTADDGMLALKTTEMIPYTVKAIQEQQQQITDLKSELQNLKNQIETLKANIH